MSSPTNTDLKLMFDLHSQGYRDALEIFVKEQNLKFERLEKAMAAMEKRSEKEISSLRDSLQFSQHEIDEHKAKLKSLQEEVDQNKAVIKTQTTQIKELTDKISYLEDSSRRSNLRFYNVPEQENETWEMTSLKVQEVLQGTMGIPHPVELDRAHRVGPVRTTTRTGEPAGPRPIVARFTRFADREHALRMAPKLKGNADRIYIKEDLCQASQQKIEDQMDDFRKAREEGKIAYFSYTKLITRSKPLNNGPTDGTRRKSTNANFKRNSSAWNRGGATGAETGGRDGGDAEGDDASQRTVTPPGAAAAASSQPDSSKLPGKGKHNAENDRRLRSDKK